MKDVPATNFKIKHIIIGYSGGVPYLLVHVNATSVCIDVDFGRTVDSFADDSTPRTPSEKGLNEERWKRIQETDESVKMIWLDVSE